MTTKKQESDFICTLACVVFIGAYLCSLGAQLMPARGRAVRDSGDSFCPAFVSCSGIEKRPCVFRRPVPRTAIIFA